MDLSPEDMAALEEEFSQESDISPEDMQALEAEFGGEASNLDSFMTGAADGATFGYGDEMRAGLQALVRGGLDPNVTMGQAYDHFLDKYRGTQEQRAEDNPYFYGGGQVAGAIGTTVAGATPLKSLSSVQKLGKYARSNPFRTAAATGGVSGGIYGFGSGEGGSGERLKEAGITGTAGLALGPVGARVGQGVSRVGQGVGSLLERTKNLLGRPGTSLSVTRPKTQALMDTSNGELLPMTGGQRTQDPARQAMETAARKGGYGDDAQRVVMDTDSQQQAAIRDVMGELGADGEESLTQAGNVARSAYKSQKAKVSSAYDDAKIINEVYVNKTPIQEQFAPRFKETLNKYNLDRRDLSEQGRRLFDDLESLKGDKISAVNLAKMEKWRGKASNIIANNNQMKGNAAEGAAFKQIVDDYDKFMAKLPEDALKSGDEDALAAIVKARGERRKQGVLFERDKTVKNIVQSQDITDEELANMVLTGSGRSEKINSGSGRLVRNLKRAAGDKAPELQDGIKRGTLARMLRKATTSTTEGDSATRVISPAKLRNEFDTLVRNKTFLKEVFSPEEIKTIEALHKDLVKIASEQPGSNNYSNTAYTLMRFVNIIPFGKAAVGEALEGLGNKSAAKDIKKGLSPVLDGMIDELTAQRRFYGAAASAPISNKPVEK